MLSSVVPEYLKQLYALHVAMIGNLADKLQQNQTATGVVS